MTAIEPNARLQSISSCKWRKETIAIRIGTSKQFTSALRLNAMLKNRVQQLDTLDHVHTTYGLSLCCLPKQYAHMSGVALRAGS
jgi:hypothetical protein